MVGSKRGLCAARRDMGENELGIVMVSRWVKGQLVLLVAMVALVELETPVMFVALQMDTTVHVPTSRHPLVAAGWTLLRYLKHNDPLPTVRNCMPIRTSVTTSTAGVGLMKYWPPPPWITCRVRFKTRITNVGGALLQEVVRDARGAAVADADAVVAGQVDARERHSQGVERCEVECDGRISHRQNAWSAHYIHGKRLVDLQLALAAAAAAHTCMVMRSVRRDVRSNATAVKLIVVAARP
jgi:hypothetical protein